MLSMDRNTTGGMDARAIVPSANSCLRPTLYTNSITAASRIVSVYSAMSRRNTVRSADTGRTKVSSSTRWRCSGVTTWAHRKAAIKGTTSSQAEATVPGFTTAATAMCHSTTSWLATSGTTSSQ